MLCMFEGEKRFTDVMFWAALPQKDQRNLRSIVDGRQTNVRTFNLNRRRGGGDKRSAKAGRMTENGMVRGFEASCGLVA